MLDHGLDDITYRCVKCALCLPGCPVYQQLLMEEASPRGKVQLARHLLGDNPAENAALSMELAESFFTCTTCGACTYACPSQVELEEVIQRARERLCASGVIPESIETLRNTIMKTHNVYTAKEKDRVATYPSHIKERMESNQLPKKADMLLFMGCVPSYLDMKIVPSFLRIIEAAGVDYTVLGTKEICCGFPLHLMGDQQNFEKNARDLISLIKETGAKELVTPCAGCYKTFVKYYPEAGNLGMEVFHSVHYIKKLIDEKKIQLNGSPEKRVTYHDPCDLGRTFQVFDEPREILKALPHIEFVEMPKNRLDARCCGGGGNVLALRPELAADMAAERVRDAMEVGAEIIVSSCSTCKDNLRKGIKAIPKEQRPKIKVMDITEIVAESIT
jgi:Fe-S oxidoreductase